ncbi:hypothetical protein [Pseudomonas phage 22PfluR64PP]|uniref:Uncharacterized protein n=1 Tax=Pseudomonas phage 22PfluR64PP TaxID=2163970 RepID=A0A2S1PDI7_9CAUD|nr:hypothetical protein HOT19_gp42 [Pseudomonas phage 22PfluR64PP]AWH14622.1 hypothetical protein [Pseudomonas phage 22PfluR64PP]
MRLQAQQQATQMADLVFTIVSTRVIDRPGCIAVNILKDRETGKTGFKIVQADFLIGRTVFA